MLICISDYWHERQYYQLSPTQNSKNETKAGSVNRTILRALSQNQKSAKGQQQSQKSIVKRLKLLLDGITVSYWLREIQNYHVFSWHILNKCQTNQCQLLLLQVIPPERDIIDYTWNSMLYRTLWTKIECDYLMSWLSTLGGGYSALGEQFAKCAETAGKISLKQLSIGMQLGDPFLQARCKLYYSISLIQIGKLRAAKYLIRQQYAFARQHKETDTRLVKMCFGIWHRLQYEYRLRAQERERLRNLLLAAADK